MRDFDWVFPDGEFAPALLEPDQIPAPSLTPAKHCEESRESAAVRCSIFLFSSVILF